VGWAVVGRSKRESGRRGSSPEVGECFEWRCEVGCVVVVGSVLPVVAAVVVVLHVGTAFLGRGFHKCEGATLTHFIKGFPRRRL